MWNLSASSKSWPLNYYKKIVCLFFIGTTGCSGQLHRSSVRLALRMQAGKKNRDHQRLSMFMDSAGDGSERWWSFSWIFSSPLQATTMVRRSTTAVRTATIGVLHSTRRRTHTTWTSIRVMWIQRTTTTGAMVLRRGLFSIYQVRPNNKKR